MLGDGTRTPAHTLVWTAGVAPNPLLRKLAPAARRLGRVEVDELLRVRGQEYVWSLGDCARVPNTRSDRPDPPTCQHALRQASRLANNLQGRPEPYGYRSGQVATLGRNKGIADVLGLRLRGFPGWRVTRTFHLYQLPLLQRKLRVVDWTASLSSAATSWSSASSGTPRGSAERRRADRRDEVVTRVPGTFVTRASRDACPGGSRERAAGFRVTAV